MKKKIVLMRIFHRGIWRISISFAFDHEINKIVRSLKGRNFSNTLGCWYVDDTEESLREILRAFKGKADVDISAISYRSESRPDNSSDETELPIDPPPENKAESVKDKDDESSFLPSGKVIRKVSEKSKFDPVEFTINDKDGRLSVKFTGRYEQEWIDEIRSYGKCYYDKVHREFLLSWTQMKVDSLSDYFASKGIEVRVIKQAVPGELKTKRDDIGTEVRSRQNNNKALEGLDKLQKYLEENRYSDRTIEAYQSMLALFFKYYNEKDPMDITHNDVSEFVNSYIIRLGFSK